MTAPQPTTAPFSGASSLLLSELVAAARAAGTANRRAPRFQVSGHIAASDVVALWQRQPVCVACGTGRGLDHVVPMSRGGPNTIANIQNLCHPCNARKGNGLARGSRSGRCLRGLHDLALDGYINPRGQRSCRRCAGGRAVLAWRRRYHVTVKRVEIDPLIAIRVGRRP